MLKKCLKWLFSTHNEGSIENGHKVFVVLGFKMKFKYFNKNKYMLTRIQQLDNETKILRDVINNSLEIRTQQLDKETKLLRSIIKNSIDITKIPPTRGNLRTVQLIKTKVLEIADYIFKKNNITYWLSFGTLIGAIRHKGFIPWDDDVDTCLMWDDYMKIPELFKDITKKYPDLYLSYGRHSYEIIRLSYKNFDVDFIPYNYMDKRYETIEEKTQFEQKWNNITQEMLKKFPQNRFIADEIHHTNRIVIDEVQKIKNRIYGYEMKENPDCGQIILSAGCLYWGTLTPVVIESKNIFPLKETKFENLTLPIPADSIEHLYECRCYGAKGAFMDFPTFKDQGFHHTQNIYNANSDYYEKILDEITEIVSDIKAEEVICH